VPLILEGFFTETSTEQGAQLSPKDGAMRCVSWNIVNCCIAVRKITFQRLQSY